MPYHFRFKGMRRCVLGGHLLLEMESVVWMTLELGTTETLVSILSYLIFMKNTAPSLRRLNFLPAEVKWQARSGGVGDGEGEDAGPRCHELTTKEGRTH